MLSLWPKAPSEITCPRCGAKVSIPSSKRNGPQSKPYCAVCGWNVERARTFLSAQLKQSVIIAALFAAYVWALTGEAWMVLLTAVWMLVVIGIPIVSRLRGLPPTRPAPVLEPLTGFAHLENADLEGITPRLDVAVEALIILVATAAIVFFPSELNRHRQVLPQARHDLLLVVITIGFIAYQLVGHAVAFYRLLRALWMEQQLAGRAMRGIGRIIDSSSGMITYEFLDYGNSLQRGKGRDYTCALYEDMPVTVLYDPEQPWLNLPAAGLQFHRLRSSPAQAKVSPPGG